MWLRITYVDSFLLVISTMFGLGSAWKSKGNVCPVSGKICLEPTGDPISEVLQDLRVAQVHVNEWPRRQGPHDSLRNSIRDGTKRKLVQELGLSAFGQPASQATALPPYCKYTHLFHDKGENMHGHGQAEAHGQFLLGRFDVLSLVTHADYDAAWKRLNGKRNPFFVIHAAALNVGENEFAPDFKDYAKVGVLNVTSYIEDTGRIFENIFHAVEQLRIQEFVWFPFGMGAFLRNLYKNDASFSQENENGKKLIQLRQALANRFVDVLKKASTPGKCVVRLCVSPSGKADEQDANAYAFLAAVRDAVLQGLLSPSAVKVDLHADAFFLAQQIADEGRLAALLNGANRCLIGNHWFDSGARLAIDENLHRRSWQMSAIAYMLNGGAEPMTRFSSDLADAVKKLGGKVVDLKLRELDSEGSFDKILAMFKSWDTSRDGRISKLELTNVLVAIGIPESDLDRIFAVVDANEDGFLSYQEFVAWVYGSHRLFFETLEKRGKSVMSGQ
jgi:hypothetical protein